MVALWVIVMAVGLVGMIVCSKKQKTNPAMQPVGILLFIVVLIGAVMLLKSMDVFGGGSSSVLSSEMRFAESRGVKIAKYVAGIAGGKEVLFIVERTTSRVIWASASSRPSRRTAAALSFSTAFPFRPRPRPTARPSRNS